MKVPLLLALFILSVFSAPKGKASLEKIPTKRQIAPILSNSEVSLACTKGTPLGDQLENALNYCEKVDELSRQIGKNGKGKGKGGKGKSGKGKGKSGKGKGKSTSGKGGKKCPSVNDVLGKLESKAKKDLCVFDILGWVDENGKVIKDVMESAIRSLPTEVAIEMSLEKIVTCATNKANEWALRPKRQRCDGTYDPAERERLDQYEANVAGMKCLKTVMSTSCRIFINKPTAAETIPLPISPGFQKPIVNGPGGLASTEEGGSSEQVGSSEEDGSSEEKGSSEEEGSSEEKGSSEEEGSSEEGGFSHEGGSSHSGGYSQGGISSHESGPSHSGGYSNEESSSQEGGSNYGHGGGGGGPVNPGNIGNLPNGWGPGNFPIGGPLPFPILPDYALPGFGRPPVQGVPGNFQQVIVESPNYPPPYLPSPSHSLPERWPSNLVAALLPADWLAENFGESDDDDEYDYEYEEYDDTEYEYEDYYGEDNEEDYYGEEYGEEYREDYVDDYVEDSTEAPSNAVQTETPSAAVAVPLPLALSEEPEVNNEPTDSPVAA